MSNQIRDELRHDMELNLRADIIYANRLDTDKFARMLDDPSQCYKFYWLEAILNLMKTTDEDISFDQIINEMICEAWHSVTKYHLHLGPTIRGKSENFLEHAVKLVETAPGLSQPAGKEDILAAIKCMEKELRADKLGLTMHVPYRLLSSFLDELTGGDRMWNQHRRLIAYMEKINKNQNILYTIVDGRGLEKKIHINKYWRQLIFDNFPVIRSWVQHKKIRFLQDRNPGVPGIIYKLSSETEHVRKLSNARDLWKQTVQTSGKPIKDIYSGVRLDMNKFDLDHFVPWSYVASDELWNLVPMDRRLNSSKSNRLPDWDCYFRGMAARQYYLYRMIFSYPNLRRMFEKCRRDNLNSTWAAETLYVEGNTQEQFCNILEHNLKIVYDSAYLQGYGVWKLPEHFLEEGTKTYG